MSRIRLRELAKRYQHRGEGRQAAIMALAGVSLEIVDGERVGVIGANGAGKSTLLQLIAGVASPTSGKLQVEGEVHAALSVGFGLREDLTGRENMYLEAEIQGLSRAELERQIERMIEFAELGEFIDRPVRTYSSGMKSRLTFTSLMFVEPEILLVDETLSAGDQFFQRKASAAIRRLCERGKIVIIVSHALETIADMCSRCIWLRDGKLAMDGDPQAVTAAYREYQHERIEQQVVAESAAFRSSWNVPPVRAVLPLRLPDGATLLSGAALKPDEPFAVELQMELDEIPSDLCVTLRIERLDGVLVTTNDFPIAVDGPRKLRVRAALDRVALGPSYYLATMEVSIGGETVARVQDNFHVRTSEPSVGGDPILYWPTSVAVGG